jgi:hypothetical protein
MLVLLEKRQSIAAFHPNASQEVLDLGSGVFALRRTPAAGEPVVALHNVGGCVQEVPGYGERLEPYEVRWQ